MADGTYFGTNGANKPPPGGIGKCFDGIFAYLGGMLGRVRSGALHDERRGVRSKRFASGPPPRAAPVGALFVLGEGESPEVVEDAGVAGAAEEVEVAAGHDGVVARPGRG